MKPEKIIVHHSASNNGFEVDNNWHKQRWPNFISLLGYHIGYQWYWDKEKGWIAGRSESEEGAHTLGGWNRKSIGICLQGNYNKELVTAEESLALSVKLDEIRKRWNLPTSAVEYHGELWPTSCCGIFLKKEVVRYRNSTGEIQRKELVKKLTMLQSLINELTKVVARLIYSQAKHK